MSQQATDYRPRLPKEWEPAIEDLKRFELKDVQSVVDIITAKKSTAILYEKGKGQVAEYSIIPTSLL